MPPQRSFPSLLRWSGPTDFGPEPLRTLPQTFPKLGRCLLAMDRCSNSLQLLCERQLATCHNFRFLLFSRGLGRKCLGGVIACPKSPQGSQRKMRIPESDMLNAMGCPQKPQQPVVIGFLKRLGLPFTKALLWNL
jgi:hypothetical protein